MKSALDSNVPFEHTAKEGRGCRGVEMPDGPSPAVPDTPGPGVRPTGPRPSGPRWPEPPAYRVHAAVPAGACVNCGSTVAGRHAVPRCWECGRTLCVDCYWHHGLSPSDHRCLACATRGPAPSLAISGGRLTSSGTADAAPAERPATAGRS